jgi:hypothetical protein
MRGSFLERKRITICHQMRSAVSAHECCSDTSLLQWLSRPEEGDSTATLAQSHGCFRVCHGQRQAARGKGTGSHGGEQAEPTTWTDPGHLDAGASTRMGQPPPGRPVEPIEVAALEGGALDHIGRNEPSRALN